MIVSGGKKVLPVIEPPPSLPYLTSYQKKDKIY